MVRLGSRRAFAGLAALAMTAAVVPGCFDLAGLGDFTVRTPVHEQLGQSIAVDKLDLLLVIDNSITSADLRTMLATTFVDFFSRLANPLCLDENRQAVPDQPVSANGACPAGSDRESPPLRDIHVGVITSSLGGHGSTACTTYPSENAQAHLQPGKPDQSYEGSGFLVWDSDAKQSPPGDSDVGVFVDRVNAILTGLSQEVGCGYEAPLEAWYRFLIDPNPFETIELVNLQAELVGTDQTVLDQRAAFLRDDSAVAIIVLSDENDCSLHDGSQSYLILEPGPFYNARAACATSPNDPCCTSCAFDPIEGCDTSQDQCQIDAPDDSPSLRCFDQKRRFGLDFLYPIDRYHQALTSPTVTDRDGVEQPNPLFAGGRDPSFVSYTAVVGVPWQDIARRDAQGNPDLIGGLASGEPTGGMLNADELVSLGVWDVILGDPANYVAPTDPFMIESPNRRSGQNPITEDPITSASDPPNAINGFDFNQGLSSNLQFACIAPLPSPSVEAECQSGVVFPTCDDEVRVAKWATPGTRHLDLVRRLGPRGALGSACWPQVDDPSAADYGYRPALVGSAGLAGRLQDQLAGSTCIPESLPLDGEGNVPCEVVEALVADLSEGCNCDGPARRAPEDADIEVIDRIRASFAANPAWNCFCFVQQPDQEIDRDACLHYVSDPVVNEVGQRVNGWCYIDSTAVPPIGNPDIVAICSDKRLLRFVGDAERRPGATLFLECE